MLYSFAVGHPCPPVVERPRPDFDGGFLEALPQGMVALLYLSGMRALERIVIQMEPVDVRVFEQDKYVWMAAIADPTYTEKYQLWLDRIWKRYRDVTRLWKLGNPVGHLIDEDHERRLRYEQTLYTSMVRQIARSERREA